MATTGYLELLDWTARQVVEGRSGATPKHVAPLLQRLGLSEATWCSVVKDFGRLFSVVAGQPQLGAAGAGEQLGPSKLVTGVRDCVAHVLHDRTGLLNCRWLYVGPCGRVEL